MLAFLLTALVCSGSDGCSSSTNVEGAACQLGDTRACQTADGCSGLKHCGSDGQFGACMCNDAGSAGTGGGGGTADAGGFQADGWSYRRPISVTNSGHPLTGYSVEVVVDTASLVSAGKLQGSGQDLRFTDASGKQLLPHWVESGIPSAQTRIWVRLPDIPSGKLTLDMYYDNPAASDSSDGAAVFELFDDFAGTTLDTSVWHKALGSGNATASVSGGMLVLKATGGTATFPSDQIELVGPRFEGSYRVGAKLGVVTGTGSTHTEVGWRSTITGTFYQSSHWAFTQYEGPSGKIDGLLSDDAGLNGAGNPSPDAYGAGPAVLGLRRLVPSGAYAYLHDGSEFTAFNATSDGGWSTNDASYPTIAAVNFSPYPGYEYDYDWCYVAKAADPEPTATVGAEQKL